MGIEKEKLNDIFNRFKQIENSGISNEFGSGIGLCLTKSLIEIQNGKIYIDSKVGEGTNVKIIFPIKEVVEEVYDNSNYNDNIEKFEIEFLIYINNKCRNLLFIYITLIRVNFIYYFSCI